MKNATANKNVANALPPVHPGEILAEEFLSPFDMSARALAAAIDVTPARVSDIIAGRRGITADTALRLGRYFGTTAQLWLTCSRTTTWRSPAANWLKRSNISAPGRHDQIEHRRESALPQSWNDQAPAFRRGLFVVWLTRRLREVHERPVRVASGPSVKCRRRFAGRRAAIARLRRC